MMRMNGSGSHGCGLMGMDDQPDWMTSEHLTGV